MGWLGKPRRAERGHSQRAELRELGPEPARLFRARLRLSDVAHIAVRPPPCHGVLAVSTYHYDTLRTGWNSHERVLTAQNVASSQFGLLQLVTLDDQVDAQPLFVADQDIAGGKHDVIYIATAANTVYAIDASTGAVLQTRNLGVPVPQATLLGCTNNAPNVGISSTPVIDVVSKTLYVMALTVVLSGNPAYQLHALDLDSFTDKVPPVVVAASQTRTDGSTYNFMAGFSRQRSGLLYANGNIYTLTPKFHRMGDALRGIVVLCKGRWGTPLNRNP